MFSHAQLIDRRTGVSVVAAVLLWAVTTTGLAAGAEWERVEAPVAVEFNDQDWYPSCADGSPFSFYVREPGGRNSTDPKASSKAASKARSKVPPKAPVKLLVYLTQGGVCWDFNTCVGTLSESPIYFPAIPDNFDPTQDSADTTFSSGILDADNKRNPYAGFVEVVVPYCTGDVHWGHSDCSYAQEGAPVCHTPSAKPAAEPEFPAVIRHRGFDNLNSVAAELVDRYGDRDVETVVIAGSSAGGYGALAAYPLIRDLWPSAKGRLVADSAVGIIGNPMYQTALGGTSVSDGTWGVERTLPDFLAAALANGVGGLHVSLYGALGTRYWPTGRGDDSNRFASYTTAFDLVQAIFLNVSNNPDNPDFWLDPYMLSASLTDFTVRARASLELASFLPHYSYYLGSGGAHVVLTDPDDPRIPIMRNLYDEASAGMPLAEWLDSMTRKARPGLWRNLSCSPSCSDPFTVLKGLQESP